MNLRKMTLFSTLVYAGMFACGEKEKPSFQKALVGNNDLVALENGNMSKKVGLVDSDGAKCVAFLTSENSIMTAKHCLGGFVDASKSLFKTAAGTSHALTGILNEWEENDLIELEIFPSSEEYFSFTEIDYSSQAQIIGFDPNNEEFMTGTAKVESTVDSTQYFLHHIDSLPGFSGGPVLQNGKVIGIHLGAVFEDDSSELIGNLALSISDPKKVVSEKIPFNSENVILEQSFSNMKRNIEKDWEEVYWSRSYGYGDAAILAACAYFGCLEFALKQELEALATRVGRQAVENALSSKGSVITSGNWEIIAGVTQYSSGLAGIERFARLYVAVRTKRTYRPIVNEGSGLCIGVDGASVAHAANVMLFNCAAGAPNQQWFVKSGGYVVNQKSGKCIGVDGASINNSANVMQFTCFFGHGNQVWTHQNSQLINGKSNRCLTVDHHAIHVNGANIVQYDCSSNSSQRWRW